MGCIPLTRQRLYAWAARGDVASHTTPVSTTRIAALRFVRARPQPGRVLVGPELDGAIFDILPRCG